MRKKLVIFVALLTAIAITVPAFALEVKYGGLFRVRWFSNDNITDGQDEDSIDPRIAIPTRFNADDNQNYFDQRIRIFFTFISSENLRGVVAFEQDVLWGDSREKGPGGHRDVIGLELKHAYLDFALPTTTVRVRAGLQPISILTGWILDEDFTALLATGKFEPITVTAGYVGERNGFRGSVFNPTTGLRDLRTWGVTDEDENVDDFVLKVDYAAGPISASLVGLYQLGHDSLLTGASAGAKSAPGAFVVNPVTGALTFSPFLPFASNAPFGDDDNLFDLGLTFSYKQDFWNVTFNFVKNFGSFERTDPDPRALGASQDVDYTGFMVEGIGNYFCGPWSFTLGAFYTSGDEDFTDDELEAFVQPIGADHHWSEILGGGSLDAAVNGNAEVGAVDTVRNRGAYNTYQGGTASPSNLWTINAGVAYQVLEGTKLTLNYYFIATAEDVVSSPRRRFPFFEEDNSIGHELDFYVDQKVVDKLMLRFVAAYLFADDAFTTFTNDDDAYEVGAVLSWSF